MKSGMRTRAIIFTAAVLLIAIVALILIFFLPRPLKAPADPFDLNTVTYAQMMTLPGMTDHFAQEILDYRTTHEYFVGVYEISFIDDMPQNLYNQLAPYFVVQGAATTAAGRTEQP
ncbi:MAG: helix-hairpin-helix domain-containing protein [Oscillospiraceae bacterium]|nr:helix-hairpin-helix domain-containing protein [Oscillospiraceae bacterium]